MDGQLLKQSEFKRILYFVAVPAEVFLLCDRNLEKAHFKCTRNGAILLLQIFALYFFFLFHESKKDSCKTRQGNASCLLVSKWPG